MDRAPSLSVQLIGIGLITHEPEKWTASLRREILKFAFLQCTDQDLPGRLRKIVEMLPVG